MLLSLRIIGSSTSHLIHNVFATKAENMRIEGKTSARNKLKQALRGSVISAGSKDTLGLCEKGLVKKAFFNERLYICFMNITALAPQSLQNIADVLFEVGAPYCLSCKINSIRLFAFYFFVTHLLQFNIFLL